MDRSSVIANRSQPHRDNITLQPTFIVTVENTHHVCEVLLPEGSPIRSAVGKSSPRKAVAKRSAAFEMCLLLRKGNHLDSNLMPTIKKYLPAMRNAHLALNMNKGNSYAMKVKPSVWERNRGSFPKELFMTVLKLETPDSLGRPSQPLALLTRTAMPDFPPIPLHLQPGKASNVLCTSMTVACQTTNLMVEKLNDFTLRIYKDIFNKTFEVNIAEMSYWLAPILDDELFDKDLETPDTLIDWQSINFVCANDEKGESLKWSRQMPKSQLANRFLVDRWNGARRFFSISVDESLDPYSPIPQDAVPYKYMNSIIDYTVSLFSKSRKRLQAEWDPEQPVVRARLMQHRLNWLENFTDKEETPGSSCYVCPEPLKFSAVSSNPDHLLVTF